MVKVYTNLSDLHREILACQVIDLIPYASLVDEKLLSCIKEGKEGLYLNASVEPIISREKKYIIGTHRSNLFKEITFDDFINDISGKVKLPPGDIVNVTDSIVMNRSTYEKLKRNLSFNNSQFNRACEIGIACVIEYLNTLCKPYMSIAKRQYDLQKLIKPEFLFLIEKEIFQNVFDNLYLEVRDFVGTDYWNYYYYKVIGTTLVIEKGLDYRVVEWHKQQIMASKEYDHDFGGIQNVRSFQNS